MCYIYRGSILGDLSQWGWREEKNHVAELSLGASGSRFPLSMPRLGGMCVLYIQRVDIRGFVTRGAGARKKIVWWN